MNIKLIRSKEAKNAGWLIAGKITQMLLSLIVGTISTRYLGPNNYGLVSYANSFVSLFMAFCTLGLNSVIVKDFLDNPDEQGTALGSSILLRAASSFLSSIMIVSICSVIDAGEKITIIVVALSSISLIFHSFDTINYWFQAQYKSKVSAAVTLIAYVITSTYKIILLILEKDIKWFAFATSIDYIAISCLLLIAYKYHKGPKLRFSFSKSKALLSKSVHYILSGMMVVIYGQTDKLMLKQMLNETEVGYYSIGTTISGMWVFVLAAIIDSVYPTILSSFSKSKDEFNKKNKQLYAVVFYFSILVSLLFFIFGDYIIAILYGADYAPAGISLKIITWYTAFSYLGVARRAWIVSNDRQKYLKYIYFFAAVFNVIGNAVLIPNFGAAGAALASLLTQIFTSLILPLLIKGLRENAILMLEAIALKGIFNKNVDKE